MKELRIGLFGAWRGQNYIYPLMNVEGMNLCAVCDKSKSRMKEFFTYLPKEMHAKVKVYEDYDEMLDNIDAVIIINYFHEHAPYAIKALKKGVHVLSECIAAGTLKECVELCEAAEESNAVYLYAECYNYTPANMETKKLYDSGKLGKFLYGEGEYNHGGSIAELEHLTPCKYHWRAWVPRTYYLSHSIGPLMYITGERPISVSAQAVHSEVLEKIEFRKNYDAYAMMTVMTDKGALMHVTGCAAIPSPGRYRVACENGSAENGATIGTNLFVNYFPWATPEGEAQSRVYTPESDHPEMQKIAEKSEHWGGDWWTVWEFARCIFDGWKPSVNVYDACAIAAVGIIGWKSCLDNGRTIPIPNFAVKEERDTVRDDADTPFPDENGNGATLPPATRYNMN